MRWTVQATEHVETVVASLPEQGQRAYGHVCERLAEDPRVGRPYHPRNPDGLQQ